MLKENVHEVFIQLQDKSVSCINIRDILSSTNIDTLKSSTIGKTIQSLTERQYRKCRKNNEFTKIEISSGNRSK
jgi:hypothetical protein